MAIPLPPVKFDNAPVIETVLAAQFSELAGYSDAHAGAFCCEYLGDGWRHFRQSSWLPDQFEQFPRPPTLPGQEVTFRSGGSPERIQIVDESDERMIQLQATRFIYNWRKRGGAYPHYENLRAEFLAHFARFAQFAEKHRLGGITPNQWEVTYINHIPKGALWQTPHDWPSIFPFLRSPSVFGSVAGEIESGNFGWRFSLGKDRARMYLNIRHGKTLGPEPREVLHLEFVVRGPPQDSTTNGVIEGFEIGHEAIVRTFEELGSPEAKAHWQWRGR